MFSFVHENLAECLREENWPIGLPCENRVWNVAVNLEAHAGARKVTLYHWVLGLTRMAWAALQLRRVD
jgi:hypothetical protein